LDITWFGQRCFSIRTKDVSIITDPYDEVLNKLTKVPLVKATTISRIHQGDLPGYRQEGSGKVVDRPGEYEISNILITGIGTSIEAQSSSQTSPTSKNIVHAIEIEGIIICHLGDLHSPLTSEQVEELGDVGILMAPVGSSAVLKASIETMGLLDPRVVIPMGYSSEIGQDQASNEALGRFLKEMGIKDLETQKRLHVTSTSLPQQIQVVLLDSAA